MSQCYGCLNEHPLIHGEHTERVTVRRAKSKINITFDPPVKVHNAIGNNATDVLSSCGIVVPKDVDACIDVLVTMRSRCTRYKPGGEGCCEDCIGFHEGCECSHCWQRGNR